MPIFFPKLSLEGFFGAQRSNLFGAQSPWSAAANALMPILDFGRIRAQVNAANAREQQAFYTYQQTVLAALEEVENALAAYTTEQRRYETLKGVAANQARAAMIVKEQYKSGVATQLDLLTTQQNQLDAENELAVSEGTRAANVVQLYRALGGEERLLGVPEIDAPQEAASAATGTTILDTTVPTVSPRATHITYSPNHPYTAGFPAVPAHAGDPCV